MTALVVLLAITVALLAVLMVGLLRTHAEILRRLHELGAGIDEPGHVHGVGPAAVEGPIRTAPGVPEPREGAGAHDVTGTTPAGDPVSVSLAGRDHPTLLAFLTTGCSTCLGFWEALADPARRMAVGTTTRVVIVTRGPEREHPAEVARLAPADVTTVLSSRAWEDHGVPVAPYFLLVDGRTGAVVGEGAAAAWDQLTGLLARATADLGGDPGPGRRDRWAAREADTDAALLAAGIEPGDPRLYQRPTTGEAGPR